MDIQTTQRKEIIMKETKQPWPRSARVTVWVLGILLFIASAYIVTNVLISGPVIYDDLYMPPIE
ncbi:hypothetical protein CXT96_04130 [Akkermansia muciniphila]|nr:hypothetical protein CXT92_02790 [Akkermansia muciniphila]PNC93270.1 hypothetical protein CXT91_02610 [Akkermansia muciniphila]PND16122.1 hypothetical protein CXT96_04130 [Akkermansia muciniphila]